MVKIVDSIGHCSLATCSLFIVIIHCVWPIIGHYDYYFGRVGGAAGCNPRSPLKISILKTAGSRSSAQMIHQQLSSICLCHLQRPLLLRTPVLSNAFVIYCISLCISSSSSFQPSLFIHFHLQFDTTSTHNEAMDKLQKYQKKIPNYEQM